MLYGPVQTSFQGVRSTTELALCFNRAAAEEKLCNAITLRSTEQNITLPPPAPDAHDGGCAPAQAECHVSADGRHDHLVVGVLEHEARRPADLAGAAVRRQQAAQQAHQRGLAAAVGAQQHVQAAARHLQAGAFQHLLPSTDTLLGTMGP